jgi:hypothetical protein
MANSVTVANTWDQIEPGSKFDADSQASDPIWKVVARIFAAAHICSWLMFFCSRRLRQ